jgi:thiol-disulfide isomerase/thioredoxin
LNRTRVFLAIAVAVAVVATAGISCYYLNLARPGFPGASINYNDSQLQGAAASGKPTLIYFSTLDCPACLMEDRAMDALLPDYNSTVNFVFMRLSSSNGMLFQDLSVLVVPTIMLADDQGIITKRYDGYAGESDLRSDLQRLL